MKRFKAFVELHIDSLLRVCRSTWYDIRCYFSPFNIVKMHELDRSWCDRDYLMMHAMCQIVVDFVELERPFCTWEDRHSILSSKRFTDLEAMRLYVEREYNTDEGRKGFYSSWDMENTPKAKSWRDEIDARTAEAYKTNTEILDIYEWYKNGKYEFVIDHVDFWGGGSEQEKLTACRKYANREEQHNAEVNNILERILKIRSSLWT